MKASAEPGAYGGGHPQRKSEPGRGAESTPLLAASGSLPMKRNTSSSVFECAQFHEDREWSGFGPTENINFGPGETVKIKYPKSYNNLMRLLIIAHFVTGCVYIVWLAEEMMSPATWVFMYLIGPMFLLAETLSFVTRIVCFVQYVTKQHKAICPLYKLEPCFPESEWPVVQFCVTHYREPVHETYQTIKNLIDMDYPMHKLEINILDDGYFNCKNGVYTVSPVGQEMTDMIRALVSRIARGHGSAHTEHSYDCASERRPEAAPQGSRVLEFKHESLPTVRQIGRRRGKESHFKGGNLNNAIFNVLDSDEFQFYAFLDCDMAPTPDFLQLSMSQFFKLDNGKWVPNWEVGMTQAPQCFNNVAETNGDDDPLFQQTDVYWRRTMAHLDYWGLVHYYGTNVVMFKPALEDILGWQYGVLSEDTPTGANLTRFGWKALYIDQNIAEGLVKDTVVDTLSQRKRWAIGNIMWGLLKARKSLKCLLTDNFYNPPFYDSYLEREKAALSGENMDIPNKSLTLLGSATTDIDAYSPEDALPTEETSSLSAAARDIGYDCRKKRATGFWQQFMWSWSYWHVTWSNPVNGYWFVAYVATALYMLSGFLFSSTAVAINVLYPAVHFAVTTTILFVIGPQSTMWRGCQDRFAFAWVRLIAIFDSLDKAMKEQRPSPWNSSAYMELMAPPFTIFLIIFSMWAFSFTNCALDYNTCFKDVSSDSYVSAIIPTQIMGLFLGSVILVSMWPLFRCSLSNMLGFPMYKFRMLPGGASVPYLLAFAPVIILGSLYVFMVVDDAAARSTTSYSAQICISGQNGENVAPSVFVVGCAKCATTSLFEDMSDHFPTLDVGTREGGKNRTHASSVSIKDKHFFDEESVYQQGWSWYTSKYSNCSTDTDNQIVGADFTETYLESGTMTARKIHADYSQLAPSHGVEVYTKLRFVVMLRDPVDRLFSYYNSAKADGTLDVTGVTLSSACKADIASCESLTFDGWAHDQVTRASDCEKANPDEGLWPSCGDTGLFGGLYELQIAEYMNYFNSSQIAVVPMEAYTNDAPQLLSNVADWLKLDFVRNGMTSAADASTSEMESASGSDVMSAATRSMLGSFYEPHVKDLYDLISRSDITFIDIMEVQDIFRR